MKILEIIQHKYTNNTVPPEKRDDNYSSGAFSVVEPDKEDPHMVNKYHKNEPNDNNNIDAFSMFAKYLVDNHITNIHFPRIYETNTDPEGKKSWKIEKLRKLGGLHPHEKIGLYNRMFNKNTAKTLSYTDDRWELPLLLDQAVRFRDLSYIIDEELKEAIIILNDMIK